MGNFQTKSKRSKSRSRSENRSEPDNVALLQNTQDAGQNAGRKTPTVTFTVTDENREHSFRQPRCGYHTDQYITINTNWRNLPPLDVEVYWMYSARNDIKSYHFMSAVDCNKLEQAYQQGEDHCTLNHGDGVTVRFDDMKQYTACGQCQRVVQRLTSDRYRQLKCEYQTYFKPENDFWALDCKSAYILFTPEFQDIINVADDKGQQAKVRLNLCYEYTINPYTLTQTNNVTGKVRRIAKVKIGKTTKPIYGSFLVKYNAMSSQSQSQSTVTETGTETETEVEQSVMEESCIYPHRQSSGAPSTAYDPLEESCIYPATHIPKPHVPSDEPTVSYQNEHDNRDGQDQNGQDRQNDQYGYVVKTWI